MIDMTNPLHIYVVKEALMKIYPEGPDVDIIMNSLKASHRLLIVMGSKADDSTILGMMNLANLAEELAKDSKS